MAQYGKEYQIMPASKYCTLIACVFLLSASSAYTQDEIVDLKFLKYSTPDSGESKSLQTLVRVRRISEQYSTGGLYLMTQYGDYEDLFRKENRKAIDHPMIDEPWRYCSIFSTKNASSVIMGRNWDNQNVGSIIVTLYKPQSGYSSISFARAIDMGFPLIVDLEDKKSTPLGRKLLLAPFYAYDGFNDQGVCASVTGIDQVKVNPAKGNDLVFISFLVRRILDQTRSIDEAIKLAEKTVPFDLDQNSLDCHFYIADSSGRSVILEYRRNGWQKIYPEKSWQVMTNKVVNDVPDATLRAECPRYKTMSEILEKNNGNVDWRAGMHMLRDVCQKGTTWSAVYSLTSKELYFSVYQTWGKIYHLRGF
jgi:hypothetical protein